MNCVTWVLIHNYIAVNFLFWAIVFLLNQIFLYCSAHSENRKAIMSSLKPSFDTIMTHKYTNHGLFQNNLSLVCVFFYLLFEILWCRAAHNDKWRPNFVTYYWWTLFIVLFVVFLFRCFFFYVSTYLLTYMYVSKRVYLFFYSHNTNHCIVMRNFGLAAINCHSSLISLICVDIFGLDS